MFQTLTAPKFSDYAYFSDNEETVDCWHSIQEFDDRSCEDLIKQSAVLREMHQTE